jgi:hypothetical protein
VNVTVELVAWNATQGPSVSHSGVYQLAALGSKQFLTFDLKDTLQEAGLSADALPQYFLRLTVRAAGSTPALDDFFFGRAATRRHPACARHPPRRSLAHACTPGKLALLCTDYHASLGSSRAVLHPLALMQWSDALTAPHQAS